MTINESYKNALEYDFCQEGEFQGNSPAEIALRMVALLENIKKAHASVVSGFMHSSQNIPISATLPWADLYGLLENVSHNG